MAIKTSAVLEDAVHRIPIAELTSGAPLSEWIIPSSNSNSSERHEDISQFEPHNYRIALVSFQNGHKRAGGNLQQADRMDRLFLLPLTWRQFVIRVREALGISQRTLFQLQTDYIAALETLWGNSIALRGFLLTDGLEAPSRPGGMDQPVRELNVPSSTSMQPQ